MTAQAWLRMNINYEADTLSWVRGVIAVKKAPFMYAGFVFCARVFTSAARKFAKSF